MALSFCRWSFNRFANYFNDSKPFGFSPLGFHNCFLRFPAVAESGKLKTENCWIKAAMQNSGRNGAQRTISSGSGNNIPSSSSGNDLLKKGPAVN